MFSKALIIDFKKREIEEPYFKRIKSLFNSIELIKRDDPQILKKLQDVEVIFCQIFTKIDKQIIDAAPKLKYIGVCSTAFDAIDAKYARSKGVTVCNLGGYSTEAVAEFFFASLLGNLRDLKRASQQAKKEDYSFANFMGLELKHKTLGVVGAGKIGSRIAEIGAGFGMKVIYSSRKNKPEIEKLGAKKKRINTILKQSDFVALMLVLNKDTEGIIDKSKINLLKQGCVFISLAPPGLIDQEAMMKRAGKSEIIFIFDHPDDIDPKLVKRFLKTENVAVYPPIAFRTKQANINRWETFVGNIEQFIKGKPQNVVN